jgi:hypothetical protein
MGQPPRVGSGVAERLHGRTAGERSKIPLAGSMDGMAREKVTITLDRSKAEDARSLVGASSTSEVVDIALDRLIRAERLRHDVAAYRRIPPTGAETQISLLADDASLDETDWESLYAVDAE